MGNGTSRIPSKLDPRDVFTSPDQVQQLLLEKLYDGSEVRSNALRALFAKKASSDDHEKQAYWTEDTFISCLIDRNSDVETATRSAGPLLFRMTKHYGAFPFPHQDEGERLTLNSFLRGVFMTSRMKDLSFWSNYGIAGNEPVTRQRTATDDVRLLFQSIASNNTEALRNPSGRSSDDDEDLLDVLFVVMYDMHYSYSPKRLIRRRDLLQVAATLPSSCSKNLQGSIRQRDLRALLELVFALLNTRLLAVSPPVHSVAIDHIMRSFSNKLGEDVDVGWETFRDVVLKSLPNLPTLLSAFFEYTFQITPYFWLESELLPEAPVRDAVRHETHQVRQRIHEVVQQSKILSTDELAQLLLILPSGLTLQFKGIQLQEVNANDHANEVESMLQAPGRLLVSKYSNRAASIGSQIICLYTGVPEALRIHLLDRRALPDGLVGFSLSPVHSVFEKTYMHLAMHITGGRGFYNMMAKSFGVGGEIEAFEIWTM